MSVAASAAKVTKVTITVKEPVAGEKTMTVRYTRKTLGGENPNDPKYKLRKKLSEIAARYSATNTSDDKELLKYLKKELPGADIWSTGTTYKFTRQLPSETVDGRVTVPIGITYDGVTLDSHNFTVVLPALCKSPESAKLSADKELMKNALINFPVTATTSGDELFKEISSSLLVTRRTLLLHAKSYLLAVILLKQQSQLIFWHLPLHCTNTNLLTTRPRRTLSRSHRLLLQMVQT